MTTGNAPTIEFKEFRRKQIAELADWCEGFDMTGVSVSDADKQAGSPKVGDKIARNPNNHADRWLVAAAYFADNFEPIQSSESQTVPVEPQRYAWTRDGMVSVTGNGEYVSSIIFDALQQVLQAEIHKHKITKQLFDEELADGDKLCSSLCFERTEGGRLPVRKMVADIGDVAMRMKRAETELAAINEAIQETKK